MDESPRHLEYSVLFSPEPSRASFEPHFIRRAIASRLPLKSPCAFIARSTSFTQEPKPKKRSTIDKNHEAFPLATLKLRQRDFMKACIIISLTAGAVVLAGCVVTSVSPFYTQSDLVYESGLTGNWIQARGGSEVWRFEQSDTKAYRFTRIEERKASVMEAHAFKLQGELFLDIHSLDQNIDVIPSHYLLRVTQLTPTLRMSQIDTTWLLGLLDKDPNAASHYVIVDEKSQDRRVVLTGDTEELQKFVTKQLNNVEAWNDTFEFRREASTYSIGRIAHE